MAKNKDKTKTTMLDAMLHTRAPRPDRKICPMVFDDKSKYNRRRRKEADRKEISDY